MEAVSGHVFGRFFTQKCSVFVSKYVLFDDALALVFRFAVGARFRWKFVLQLSSFSLRAKRRTSGKCNPLHAKTCFFKVRPRAGAATRKEKRKEKRKGKRKAKRKENRNGESYKDTIKRSSAVRGRGVRSDIFRRLDDRAGDWAEDG